MSSACTPHRLVGRRVRRKFASCFFARRIRLEEKTNAYSRKSPETSHGSIVKDFTGGEGSRASAKKSKENEGKKVQNSPSHSNRIGGDEAEPHVADKDYLVFCFGEDGAIDIVDDGGDDDHDNIATAGADADADADAVGSQKGGEKGSKDDEIEEINNVEGEQPNTSKMEQYESCDSNLSDTSSGSFAFPILKIEEWIGSPVHMPKNGNQNLRLHCCRF